MAQTALPCEFSASRDSTIAILVYILNSSPIAPMVKVRLLDMSRAERTKLVREVTKESNPMRRPELFIDNCEGEERNLKERFSFS